MHLDNPIEEEDSPITPDTAPISADDLTLPEEGQEKPQPETKRLSIDLPTELINAFDARIKEQNLSRKDAVAQLIYTYVHQEGASIVPPPPQGALFPRRLDPIRRVRRG